MKKGLVLILVLILLLSIVSFIPVSQKTTVTISATFENTVLQIIHLDNWKNWYPGINLGYKKNPAGYSLKRDTSGKIYTIISSGKKFIIHAITPMSYQVIENDSGSENIFAFTVFPGTIPHTMQLFLEKKNSLILTLFDHNRAGETALNGLKFYLEDPKSFYGFKIEVGKIRDSIIASNVFKIKRKEQFAKIHEGILNLEKYLKANNLTKTGHSSISYVPLRGDSLQITIGLPVNKIAASASGINCLSLPGNGKVLVGDYEGKFSDRQKIYSAMSKYMIDHTLSPPAEAFERYLNDSIPSSDSSFIKMELNYPVY
jgi:effector-binding domain-containing protein